jgi:hypothetical protein
MGRRWIFQSNPERYDINAALASLKIIHWRVPQYTSNVHRGDLVIIWRSNPDAGIVGVGTVLDEPHAAAALIEETPFAKKSEEIGQVTTRVALRVAGITPIPKGLVAQLPGMSDHPIITAPMQTVYPINDQQWESLKVLLPEFPATQTGAGRAQGAQFPDPFAWSQRRKGVAPLPGGYDEYARTLARILQWVTQSQPDAQHLESWLVQDFKVSASYSRHVLDFLERTSLLQTQAGQVRVTVEGNRWLTTLDSMYLIALLHSRIQFIGELLACLTPSKSPEQLLKLANDSYSMGWTTRAQIDRRRGWLQSCGAIQADAEGRLSLTDLGREALSRLNLYPPNKVEPQVEEPAPSGALREGDLPVATPPTLAGEIATRLRDAAAKPTIPAEFEKAVAEAFGFLGFVSTRIGGSGKTDVIVDADFGPGLRYRVIIDCKTTGHEAVVDQQVDWITLRDHKKLHEADYVAVVAPAFSGARVAKRARDELVALIDADALASLCLQHEKAPAGLETYRQLFANPDAQAAIAAIAEAADAARQLAELAAAILALVDRLERTEGAVSARDLYWNLKQMGDQFPTVTDQDIQGILDGLASPAMGLLRVAGSAKYLSLGSLETSVRRLRLLESLIEQAK